MPKYRIRAAYVPIYRVVTPYAIMEHATSKALWLCMPSPANMRQEFNFGGAVSLGDDVIFGLLNRVLWIIDDTAV